MPPVPAAQTSEPARGRGHVLARLRAPVATLAIATAALAAPAALHAQDDSCSGEGADWVLNSVDFRGNQVFGDGDLQEQIINEPSSLLRRIFRFFGARRCLRSDELPGDVVRLMLFYRRHGFPQVRVDTVVTRRDRENEARLRFDITEGPAARVDSVVVIGAFDDSTRRAIRDLVLLQPSERLDQFELDSSRVAVQAALLDRGFLQARVTTRTQLEPDLRSGYAVLEAEVGPRVTLEHVHVTSTPRPGGNGLHVTESQVERLTRLREGAVLRGSRLADARDNLLDAGIFGAVDVRLDSIRQVSPDSALADVRVTVFETNQYELLPRVGYGTLDCGRVQVEGQRLASIRPAGRLETTLRVSKIGVGEPLDFARSLCSGYARRDIYGQRFNYYAGLTYSHPALGRRGTSRSLTIYTERRSEYQAYLRTTSIGLLGSLSRRLPRRWIWSAAYDFGYGRTEAEPSVQCWILGACLPEDRAALTQATSLGILSTAVSRTVTDDPVDPRRGFSIRLEGRGALEAIGSNSRDQFAGALLDLARYHPMGNRFVLAGRVRLGALRNIGGGTNIPQQERLFAGGANTVRGAGQNEVGPVVYVPDSIVYRDVNGELVPLAYPDSTPGYRVIPTGGNTMAIANAEVRWRAPFFNDILQFVTFLDGGAAWNREGEFGGFDVNLMRWTPGVGVRATTPIGPIRLDIGYNNYARVPGPAFRDVASDDVRDRPLYCVSPGNTLGLSPDPNGGPDLQEQGSCPRTFAPNKPGSIWRRLTLHFSIGQAF